MLPEILSRLNSGDRSSGHSSPPQILVPMSRGIVGMRTIIKTSLVGSALMLLAGCTGYLTNYQTPCVQGHVCECRQYTTINRSWLDCRDYGRGKSKAY